MASSDSIDDKCLHLQSVDADADGYSDDGDEYEKLEKFDGTDAYGKLIKNRERNREHAKRTRLRKKALMESMKGKLIELQTEATRLQQAVDEQSTASILLCLGVQQGQGEGITDASLVEKLKLESNLDVSSLKGNIIDQLRSKVRCEAAKQKQLGKEMLRIKSSSMGFATSGDGSASPMKRQRTGSITSVDAPTSSSAAHMDADVDLETGEVDPDTIQPLPKSVVNWKNGTVSSEDGVERKLSDEEMEILRKERNRIHAKLTRDRKKLFTSRMQQMISTLEQQNLTLRDRLKSVANGVANLIPGPTQAQALAMGGPDGSNGDSAKRVVQAATQLPAATLTFQAHAQGQGQAQFQPQLLQQIHPQLLSLFPMGVNAAGFPQSIFFGGLPVNMSVGANGVPQQMVTIALPVPLSAAALSGVLPAGMQQHEAVFQAIPAAMLSEGGLVTLSAPLTAASSASDLPSQVSRASSPTSTADVASTVLSAAASNVTDASEKVVPTVEPIAAQAEVKVEKPTEKSVALDLTSAESVTLQPL